MLWCHPCFAGRRLLLLERKLRARPSEFSRDVMCCSPVPTGASEVRALFASLGHKLSDQKLFDVMEQVDHSDQVSNSRVWGWDMVP